LPCAPQGVKGTDDDDDDDLENITNEVVMFVVLLYCNCFVRCFVQTDIIFAILQ
jgi:hypothetical protein